MDNIRFKEHPPWYARGTPVINIRDGPAMANHDKSLFAICRDSSARGEAGKCMNALMRECMNEVGRPKSEDRSKEKPGGKNRCWLTLQTTFFNTQNSVSNQWYGVLGRKLVFVIVDADISFVDADRSKDAVRSEERTTVDFDLSACVAPDNVKIMEDNIELEMDDNVKLKKMDDNVKMKMMDEISNWKRRVNCLTTNFN